jgi:hypothetical protein
MKPFLFAIASLFAFCAATARAQTSYPMLMSLKPVAAQVGQSSEHTINSRYSMYGAYQVLVTGAGVTGEILHPEMKEEEKEKPPSLQTMKVRFNVAPDALPGVRDFRIITPQGASTLGQLVIARETVVSESGNNNTAEQAQAITVPATVCGTIEKAEDVDFFKFHVEAGMSLSFHVRSMRLQDRVHDLQQHSDPIIAVRNASGTTLATSDNYFFGDPFLTYRFEHAGDYFLEIRDVRYQGNQYWEYSIEISDQPFVAGVYPMGVARGQQAKLHLVGFQLPEKFETAISVPMDMPPGPQWLTLPMGESLTSPAPVVVSDLPAAIEAEGNNDTPETAQTISIPAGINGRIESESAVDCYLFEAKKGEHFSFEVIARRQQSRLDSHLRILDEKGKQLALNDDMRVGKRSFADSLVENWTAPADGKYVIEIRDLHLRGGDDFVYFVEVTRAEPRFELYVDTDKTQLTPGTGGVIYVRVERKNGFTGEVQLHIDGLPEGVSADCGRILDDKGQDGCISLIAAPDAPLSAANITIRGTAKHETSDGQTIELSAVASSYQETYQPGGGRGHWPVQMHTVAIGSPSDIRKVELSTTDVTLKPGESKRIEITIERAPEFKANVTLDVIYKHLNSVYGNSLPPGVTIDTKNSKTLLTGDNSAGYITLTAAANAPPVEKQQVPVMAHIALNFVMKATYCSAPLSVTVEKP